MQKHSLACRSIHMLSCSFDDVLTLSIIVRYIMNKKLLTTSEAADYLNVSKAFLERDRWAGAKIPFIQVGSRAVRYQQTTLDEYLLSRVRRSTSDIGR